MMELLIGVFLASVFLWMFFGSVTTEFDSGILSPEFKQILSKLDKIEAIRLLRKKTGCGLRDAKDCVELLQKEVESK